MSDPSGPRGDGGDPRAAEAFLQRWSRRKAESRTGGTPSPEPTGEAAEEPPADPGEAGDGAAEGGAGELTDADMPPLEELDGRSDASPFFAAGVSEDLRQRALRRILHSPEFNHRDGLEVYDEDYRSFQGLGGILTSHMRRRLEREAERLARREDAEEGHAESGEPEPGEEDPEPSPGSPTA